MVTHKYITGIVSGIMAAALLVCVMAMAFSEQLVDAFGGSVVAMQYESELFDRNEIIHIDIRMNEGEWADMLADASEEEYYSCDVVINGQTIYNTGIRPKGNTSLSAIAMDPDTDRFSLKLEFDHYVEGQTCYGLDKLILNNNYADSTNMKEALVYDMFQYLGADASLYNYAEISVNGEYWGVYLALEAVEDSFLLRNYGTEDGKLYKPESMDGGGGFNAGSADFADRGRQTFEREMPDGETPGNENIPGDGSIPGNGSTPEIPDMGEREQPGNGGFPGDGSVPEIPDMDEREMPGSGSFPGDGSAPEIPDIGEREQPDSGSFPGGRNTPGMDRGFGMSSENSYGADLNYTDDDLDSYSTIWEGEVTETGKEDHKRVITALKNISEKNEPEKYMDIDNLLKYMAVHTFSVNMDSLSGNMAHNYYLYEHNGKLNILPWDYNLSFGGMNRGTSGNASEVINSAIDTPFQGTEFFDVLLENDEYLSRYHEYLRILTEEYVFGGIFEETCNRIRSQIDSLVAEDPTAFYSYEEYVAGADMLRQTVMLRAESIKGQLEGTIPSTDAGQRADSSGLVDASEINIQTMGSFNMGNGQNREAGAFGMGNESDQNREAGAFGTENENRSREVGAFGMGNESGQDREVGAFGMGNRQNQEFRSADFGNIPGMPGNGNPNSVFSNMAVYGVCLLIAGVAFTMVKLYRRKRCFQHSL